MFLWIRLNSELLRYQGVQNFAKNNTENAELASKMLKQQHFLYQRKNLSLPILGRIFSGELISEDNYRFSPSEFFQYRTGLYLGQRRRRRIRGDMTARSATRSPPIKTKESLEI